MNKVGIMTFFNDNHGAFLQAYALQKVLCDIGYDAEIINYNYRKYKCVLGVELSYLKDNPITFAKLMIPAVVHFWSSRKRQSVFNVSIADKLKVSNKEYCSPNEIASSFPYYDVYITGSDQVFNPSLSPYTFPIRCLSFIDGNTTVKASYAASVAQSKLSNDQVFEFSELLKDFKGISVREKNSIELIKKSFHKQVVSHIDPTLLLSGEKWAEFAGTSEKEQEYILVYKLKGQPELDKYVSEVSKQTGLPIINCGRVIKIKGCKVRQEKYLSPEKFVELFKGAKYIVTNSFHGAVFSVIFHSRVRVFVPNGTGIRITELLDLLNLQCLLSSNVITDNFVKMYENTEAVISEERNKSLDYLRQWYVDVQHKKNDKSVIPVLNSLDCCGCASCIDECPKHLICFSENNRGFLTAKFENANSCLNCGKCREVCPMYSHKKGLNYESNVWYGHANDDDLLKKSSSGAVFGMIAKRMIAEGWIVYGAVMDMQTGNVRHIGSDHCALDEMLMSKYVQSDAYSSYKDIQIQLQNGKKVLFCGTPCQVYGLKSAMRHIDNKGKLITIDFICHGTPSRSFFRDYFRMIREEMRGISRYEFRTKVKGWPNMKVLMISANQKMKKIVKSNFDVFSYLFLENRTLNSACVDCPFCNDHFADITIADFWGWKKVRPIIKDYKKGLSFVVANTSDGNSVFESLKDGGQFVELENNYIKYAYEHRKEVQLAKTRIETFFADYEKYGYDGVRKKYASHMMLRAVLRKLRCLK